MTVVDSVEVIWPGLKKQIVKNITADQMITFNIEDAGKNEFFSGRNIAANRKLVEYDSPFEPHIENRYIDFDYEGLIAQMLSTEGPAMDVGDLNMDGLDDVFIGGATGFVGQIYLQSPSGKMRIQRNDCFEKDKRFEDSAARFLDADGDGDPDLYVGSGGNDKASDSRLLRDRLYINNGKGIYSKSSQRSCCCGI